MKLFLDDIRDPSTVGLDDSEWIIARSYSGAIALIEEHGFPEEVSFDHDLGKSPILEEKTGLDLAHYLVDLDLDTGTMPDKFSYRVHSANPVGVANITSLMEGYLRFRDDDGA